MFHAPPQFLPNSGEQLVEGSLGAAHLPSEILLRRARGVGRDHQIPPCIGQLFEAGLEGHESPLVKRHLGGCLVGEGLDHRLVEQEAIAGMGYTARAAVTAGMRSPKRDH